MSSLLKTTALAISLALAGAYANSYAVAAVPGWSNSAITNGSISDASSTTGDFNFEQLKKRQVKAVFTYALGGGNDSYNLPEYKHPTKTINLIEQARNLEKSYGNEAKVMPVIVIYTAGGSSSDDAVNVDLGQNPDYPNNLWMRYYNLIRIAQVAESYKDADHPVPATFIINPDFLGEVHKSCQQYYCPIPYKTMRIPVASALQKAFAELKADGYLQNIPQIPASFNSDQASFSDYLNSIDWLLKTISPDVPFGWQDNVWAGDSAGHRWLHKAATEPDGQTILEQHIQDEATYLNSFNFYNANNPYRPDFIAFDKWERDNWDASLDGAGINNGYLYNAPAWQVYFNFVDGISKALNNAPVMLFQIPGGHMQVNDDIDQRGDHGSTAPDYILGDSNIQAGLANVQQYMLDTTFKDPTTDYDISNNSVSAYINTCPTQPADPTGCVNGQYTWHQSHWQTLINDNVFAIMWGGGSTTSIVGMSAGLDDNGWLYQRLQTLVH